MKLNYPKYSLDPGNGGGPTIAPTSEMEAGIDAIPATMPAGPVPSFVPENSIAAVRGDKPAPAPTPATPVTEPASTSDSAPAKPSEPVNDEFGGLRKKPSAAAETAAAPASEEPKSPKALREAYNLTKKELADAKSKFDELARAKEEGTKAEIAKARAEWQSELDGLKKKYEEAETKTRYLDYTRSDEYAEKFEQPIQSAWQSAMRDIKGVNVQNDDGTERPATAQDIAALATMDPGPAWKKAKEMFDDFAPEIMGHRKEILRLNDAKQSAIEEWKNKGSEMQDRERRAMDELQSNLVRSFESRQEELRKSAPELFEIPSEDSESKQYAETAEKLNALAFKGIGLKDGISNEERRSIIARTQADIAARNRTWPYHVLRANRAEAELEKLKAELNKVKGTEPSPGGGNVKPADTGKRTPSSMEDITSGIDEIPAIGRG